MLQKTSSKNAKESRKLGCTKLFLDRSLGFVQKKRVHPEFVGYFASETFYTDGFFATLR